jgi:PAS domain S-box-containing protein
MATSETTILVVEPEPGNGERRVAAFSPLGGSRIVATVPQALVELAAGGVWMCVISERCNQNELVSIVHAARKRGVLSVLAADQPALGDYERAMAAGCRGVLMPKDSTERAASFLAAATMMQRVHSLEQQELQAIQGRYEVLRERCAEQAERFQETQETYFLDLSRVMTIISNIMDGIVFVDRDGSVTLLNPVAEDLLGVKAFAAIGKPFESLTGRTELLAALAGDHARVSGQREVTQTVEVHHSEQDLLYIKCITSRVADYRGRPAGTLTVLKDVTAEYKSDQLKNQYLSIVAHELRTPLTGIKTFSTMMAKGSLGQLTEQQQRVTESIREQSLRLEHQIDKLINLGHLESDEYGQDREVFTVDDFVAGLMLPFEQPARDRQIALSFRCEARPVDSLYADRADLRRACQALVENAVKFTPDGGTVDVRILRNRDGVLRFCVKDSGIGIDPRYHRRIFEKFFQVEDPLTRHHGGAGLGLFVAKGIVEAHGSRIEVSSRLGQGAEFSFVLPQHVSSPAEEPASAAPVAE